MNRRKNRKAGVGPRPSKEVLARSLAGIVEAGFLMAAADGEIVEQELQVIASVVRGALDGQVTDDQVMDVFEACDNRLENEGWDTCVDLMASLLRDDEARQLALFTAAAVLVSDREFVAGKEDEAYLQISDALGFSEDEASAILDEAVAAYG